MIVERIKEKILILTSITNKFNTDLAYVSR